MKYDKSYFNEKSTKQVSLYKQYRLLLENTGIELKNKKICDVGCATGNFLEELIKDNQCYGVDISPFAISECQRKFPDIKEHFTVLNLDQEVISSKVKFDLITMFDVIEHLYNFENLQQILNINLAKNGYLVVTTPNANSVYRFISKQGFTGEMDQTHVLLFTPYTLDFFMRRIGMKKVTLFTPFSFYFKNNPITRSILLGGQVVAVYQKNDKA